MLRQDLQIADLLRAEQGNSLGPLDPDQGFFIASEAFDDAVDAPDLKEPQEAPGHL